MKRNTRLIALSSIFLAATAVFAGGLDPDGSPGSTMRTLEEVEPSTPISSADLPLTIDTAGTTYHLTESVSGLSSTAAITVDAEDVTIDLRGFTLSGDGSARGIDGTSNAEGFELRNGRLSGFTFGVEMSSTTRTRLIDLRVTDSYYSGIGVGGYSEVIRCEATDNGGYGILAGGRTVIRDSVAYNNAEGGIESGVSSLVEHCLASGNGETGIKVGSHSTVRASVAASNGDDGILATTGLVEGCTADGNGGDGIEVQEEALVTGNKASSNGDSTLGAGIRVTQSRTRIEGNHVTQNDYGIQVETLGNTIIRNSARGNAANYDIVSGNDVGPLGKARTATSPWANMDY